MALSSLPRGLPVINAPLRADHRPRVTVAKPPRDTVLLTGLHGLHWGDSLPLPALQFSGFRQMRSRSTSTSPAWHRIVPPAQEAPWSSHSSLPSPRTQFSSLFLAVGSGLAVGFGMAARLPPGLWGGCVGCPHTTLQHRAGQRAAGCSEVRDGRRRALKGRELRGLALAGGGGVRARDGGTPQMSHSPPC